MFDPDRLPNADAGRPSRDGGLLQFYSLAGEALPWLALGALALALIGLTVGLRVSTTALHQGDSDRILFLHLPATAMTIVLYLLMTVWAVIGIVLNSRAASMMASALAPTGALMAFVALWTGSLWGKPTWGTWWVWDARLSALLVLLGFFLLFIAVQELVEDVQQADRAAARVSMFGLAALAGVFLWLRANDALQPTAAAARTGAALLPNGMLTGMAIMALALLLYCMASALSRLRSIILERERDADWVDGVLRSSA